MTKGGHKQRIPSVNDTPRVDRDDECSDDREAHCKVLLTTVISGSRVTIHMDTHVQRFLKAYEEREPGVPLGPVKYYRK